MTDRYFAFRNDECWGVWDRGAKNGWNGVVETFPRSRKGQLQAEALADKLNAQVRARKES